MTLAGSTTRRRIVLAVKLLIVAVVLWLVRGTLSQSWHYLQSQLVEHPRSLRLDWLALSGGLYLAALLPEGRLLDAERPFRFACETKGFALASRNSLKS